MSFLEPQRPMQQRESKRNTGGKETRGKCVLKKEKQNPKHWQKETPSAERTGLPPWVTPHLSVLARRGAAVARVPLPATAPTLPLAVTHAGHPLNTGRDRRAALTQQQ